jgi:hypothetical protein
MKVSCEAARLLDQLGEQYEQEHEAEVKELLRYCPAEAAATEAAADGGITAVNSCTGLGALASAGGPGAAQQEWLPTALAAAPPRLGARLLVQGNAGRLLAPMCAELSSWQAGPRTRCEGICARGGLGCCCGFNIIQHR